MSLIASLFTCIGVVLGTMVSPGRTTVAYTLRADGVDTTVIHVEMRIRNVRDTFRLAMFAHPEYDDRYWRYVDQLRVDGQGATTSIAREDSALWRVAGRGGDVVVRYRIRLPDAPPGQRAAWRPFLSPTGGLVGGPHSFMYVLGATDAVSTVRLELPTGWSVATGLDSAGDARSLTAPSVGMLMDSPILIGRLRRWSFSASGVPHEVAYWPLPNATPFDTAKFVQQLSELARQSITLFGRAPYARYTFLLQDGAYGGLEHANSVTLGAPSTTLASEVAPLLNEIAHEFIHTWNLVHIQPIERGAVTYLPNGRTTSLWFSEGLTMYYADLLARRGGLPVSDSTRLAHLQRLIARYYAAPGNTHVAPETASFNEYGAPEFANGDYSPSSHLQGELLGTVMDARIREASNGRRSIDDVMRLMMTRHGGTRGFTPADLERAFGETCGCDVRTFFDAHVRHSTPLDFNELLRPIGLGVTVRWIPALERDGKPMIDLRIRAFNATPASPLRLMLWNPSSSWGRAGLHSGDTLVSINEKPMRTWTDMRTALSEAKLGDTLRVLVGRPAGRWRTTVAISGFDTPDVRIAPRADATPAQRERLGAWLKGQP